MKETEFRICFDSQTIVVHSDLDEVVSRLSVSFGHMLESESRETVGRIGLLERSGFYYVSGTREGTVRFDSLAHAIQGLGQEIRLQFIHARPDLLWFHAGAVARDGRAVVVSGPSASGKSTIVSRMCSLGWLYLSDELVPLNPRTGRAVPFPQAPAVRVGTGYSLPLLSARQLPKVVGSLDGAAVCRARLPVSTVVCPTYDAQASATLERYSPATATVEILKECVNFVHHREKAIRYVCTLAKRVPTFQLRFGNSELAAEFVARAVVALRVAQTATNDAGEGVRA